MCKKQTCHKKLLQFKAQETIHRLGYLINRSKTKSKSYQFQENNKFISRLISIYLSEFIKKLKTRFSFKVKLFIKEKGKHTKAIFQTAGPYILIIRVYSYLFFIFHFWSSNPFNQKLLESIKNHLQESELQWIRTLNF